MTSNEMNPKDEMLLELSALLDGELDREERTAILDRLATDGECRNVYLEMRRMEEVVRSAELPGTLPGRIWRTIQTRVGMTPRRSRERAWLRPVAVPMWAMSAAAVLVLTLLLWGNVPTVTPPSALRPQPGVTIQVGLGEDKASMDDERFVELTTELLRADRRYHRKMLEVMQEVDVDAFIAEGSTDVGGAGSGDDEPATSRRREEVSS
ncbi:MAG: hypothetical protein R3E97_07155 [Candidatus Eisenbacteria bacterium]